MNREHTAGPASVAAGILAGICMIIAGGLIIPRQRPDGDLGICLPSPNLWPDVTWEYALNAILIGAAVLIVFFLNKKFAFVKGAETMLPTAMAVLLASDPLVTSGFGTPVIMLLVNLTCLWTLMGSYRSSNATHSMFAVATYLSLGSMFQYAFLPMMIIWPVMAAMSKVLRAKEITAYLMGLVAPYWVVLGLGIVTFSDFNIPQFFITFPDTESGEYIFLILLSLGTMALVGLTMALNNAMMIYSGSVRVRIFNNMINLLGLWCFLCMLVDFGNIGAYASTFTFAVSVQIANFFAIRRIPRSSLWFWSLLAVFIIYYILMLLS